jgi:hypothetical protein
VRKASRFEVGDKVWAIVDGVQSGPFLVSIVLGQEAYRLCDESGLQWQNGAHIKGAFLRMVVMP